MTLVSTNPFCANGGERLASVGVGTRMPGSWPRKWRPRSSTLDGARPDERLLVCKSLISGRIRPRIGVHSQQKALDASGNHQSTRSNEHFTTHDLILLCRQNWQTQVLADESSPVKFAIDRPHSFWTRGGLRIQRDRKPEVTTGSFPVLRYIQYITPLPY